MQGKSKISAVIVAKNEENYLQDCLESVKWADEIVLVDGFSTDKTREIAKDYGAKIHLKEWIGYAKTKNYAVSLAEGPSILLIDADEVLGRGLKEEIEEMIQNSNSQEGTVYRIPIIEFLMNRLITPPGKNSGIIRLFKKGDGCFKGSVHETFITKYQKKSLNNPILHDRTRTIKRLLMKIHKYSEIESKELVGKNIHPSLAKMMYSPAIYFLNIFFVEKRFVRGIAGFIYSSLMTYYLFISLLKARNRHH